MGRSDDGEEADVSVTMTPARVSGTTAGGRGEVVVRDIRPIARDTVEFVLARPDGSRLPDWEPGAHIDVLLPDGRTRQYSLCGDRRDAASYRIAVLREPDGRGGSAYLHDRVGVGDVLGFGGPRNNFRLAPAAEYLFVAGGIGITPIRPMIRQADELGIPWRLLYLGRSRDRLAYLDEVEVHGGAVTTHAADLRGRADLDTWRPTDPGVRVWACGPGRLLDAVAAWGAPTGGFPPRVERFTARTDDAGPATRFEVVAARSGRSVAVEPGETIVQALGRCDVGILTSCGQGVCGTCETDVVSGVPDHRDSILDDAERAEGRVILPCVSRCRGDRLVLDL